jgi:ABC-type transporter Mla MlaB component
VTPSNADGGTTRDHGVTPSNAEGGTTRDVVLVLDGDVEVVLWRMDGIADPDLQIVDALARLQLAARQVGGSIRLRNPCERLRALLDFVGLSDVFPEVVIDGTGMPERENPEA